MYIPGGMEKEESLLFQVRQEITQFVLGPAISRETLKARQKFGFAMAGNGMQL